MFMFTNLPESTSVSEWPNEEQMIHRICKAKRGAQLHGEINQSETLTPSLNISQVPTIRDRFDPARSGGHMWSVRLRNIYTSNHQENEW